MKLCILSHFAHTCLPACAANYVRLFLITQQLVGTLFQFTLCNPAAFLFFQCFASTEAARRAIASSPLQGYAGDRAECRTFRNDQIRREDGRH